MQRARARELSVGNGFQLSERGLQRGLASAAPLLLLAHRVISRPRDWHMIMPGQVTRLTTHTHTGSQGSVVRGWTPPCQPFQIAVLGG